MSLLYDALEFFWKALRHLRCHDIHTLRQHLPEKKTWDSFMPQLSGSLITVEELDRLQEVFSRYNPEWKRDSQDRLDARYAHRQFSHQEAEQQLADVRTRVAPILAKIHRQLGSSPGKVLLGILDGYFGLDRKAEKPCTEKPWADYEKGGIEGWRAALDSSLGPTVDVSLIAVTDISPKFSIVINPFGECYPELPSAPDVTPGYQMIKDYIYSGGVFVTAGGNPFHYLFNVLEGKRYDTSTVIPNVPISLRPVPDKTGNVVIEVQTTALLSNMFLSRDFGVSTTITLRNEHRADYPVDAFQSPEDRQYWDCQVAEKGQGGLPHSSSAQGQDRAVCH